MPQGEKRTNGWLKGTQIKGVSRHTIMTPRRKEIRDQTWDILRQVLQAHIAASPKGAAAKLAKHLGVKHSQVHRWLCPICEHDAEPRYSIGKQMEIYLATQTRILR